MSALLREPRFCPHCGTGLRPVEADKGMHPGCTTCGYVWFPDPKVAACAYAVVDNKLLLVQRKRPPVGLWCLPGGFVNSDESPEDAVTRELREETNLEIAALVLQAVYADTKQGIVLIAYDATVVGGTLVADLEECMDARFFTKNDMPCEDELAFVTGRAAILGWRNRQR